MTLKTYAAIDIGSNAGRMLIGYVQNDGKRKFIKKMSLTRVPLRLGESVFTSGRIVSDKERMFLFTMKAFKNLMEAYQVEDYRAVATSAMREADNSADLIKKIKQESGIDLELISGNEEADIIFKTFLTQNIDHTKNYLFVDVGGGSTEITIISGGQRIKSKSFKIGTIRILKDMVKDSEWEKLEKWLSKKLSEWDNVKAIGTGGNANRLIKMAGKKYLQAVSKKELDGIYKELASHSFEERIEKFHMKPDRADVIEPALRIYSRVMSLCGIEEMIVPKIGLTDGLIVEMSENS